MRSYLVHLVITLSFVQLSFQYRSYPRRNTRDHSSLGVCPSQCRCMNLNQRTVRGLFDSWNIGKSWQSTEPNESGRSVVCQGLRELPSDIPSDVTKLTVYGDSSKIRSRDTRHLISDTQLQYINRNSFRNSVSIKEVILSGNNIAIMYPSVFHYLRSLKTLSLTNNNIRHLSAATFNGLGNLHELKLSDNMIKFLPYALFTYLAELKSLYLNGNKIKRLPRDVFKSLKHLQVLDLSRNNVSDFYDDVFDHNGELQELLLNGNRLWSIRPRWFQNLYSLRILSLRGNAILTVPKEAFSNLFNLEELLLSANHIEEIEDGAFDNLRDLKSLDLSTNDLSEIRSTHLSDLDSVAELFLSNNKLVKIRNGTFEHTRQLKLLDLSRNDISKVETASLTSLRQLQILDLSHNKIQKLPKGIVYGIENLEELRLDHNFIGTIEQGVFVTSSVSRLSKMRRLELNNNNLRKLDAYTFKGVPRLRILTLGNNNIRTINQHAFSVFQYLEELTLNNNKLRDLNNGIFQNLKTVYSIDLSNNRIRTIGENTLVGLDKLEDLVLSGNKLNSIHKLALRAVPNLNTLDLKENRLVSFNFSYITNMAELSVIDFSKNHLFWVDIPTGAYLRLKDLILSENNLQTLSSNINNIMGRSSIISLDNNPWSCDCKMQWAVQSKKKIRLDSTKDVMCKTPTELHGKKFTDIDSTDMTCETKNKTKDDVTLTCTDDVFTKRPMKGRKSIGKEIMKKHVTVYRNRGDYVTDGAMLTDEWAMVPAGALKYLSNEDMRAKIGRAKTSFKISNIIEHPLLSLGMQRFNVALIRLVKRKSLPVVENQCIISEKQLRSLSSVIPAFYVSIRMDGNKPKTKLKIRKGKVSHKCANDKDYICGVVKEYKKDKFSSVDGAPLYVGHSSNLRLAGIGTRSWSNQKSIFYFIPLWTVSEWANDVIVEFDLKCKQVKHGKVYCKDLRLPLADDIYLKIQNTERH